MYYITTGPPHSCQTWRELCVPVTELCVPVTEPYAIARENQNKYEFTTTLLSIRTAW